LNAREGKYAIHLRSDLELITRQISFFDGAIGGAAVIEASAGIPTLLSLAIFAAHAVDAYRTG
jgi:hypothetical protein